jgi:hypothetical protein
MMLPFQQLIRVFVASAAAMFAAAAPSPVDTSPRALVPYELRPQHEARAGAFNANLYSGTSCTGTLLDYKNNFHAMCSTSTGCYVNVPNAR